MLDVLNLLVLVENPAHIVLIEGLDGVLILIFTGGFVVVERVDCFLCNLLNDFLGHVKSQFHHHRLFLTFLAFYFLCRGIWRFFIDDILGCNCFSPSFGPLFIQNFC